MSWFEQFKLRLQFFTVFVALLCPGFLIWMASGAGRQFASYQWPQVPGTVLTLVAKSWLDSERVTKYFGRVVYKYEVQGKTYTSDLTDLGPGTKQSDQATALADVSQYHRGDKVTVYYDPNDPSVGVLEKGVPQIHKILFVILAVGSLVSLIGSVFVLRSWVLAWRAPKPA